jgi:RND family efflux transporter MFP subunit
MKKGLIIGFTAVAIIAIIVLKLKANKEIVDKKIYIHDTTAAVLVEATTPKNHTFESAYSFLGTFEAIHQNTIGADGGGKVIQLSIEEGDRVSKGQVIAKLDDELLQLQLQNAEVSIEGQKNDENRYNNLAKENAVSGVTLEKTKLGVRSAEIQRKQLQKQLKNATIKAPFSGVITKRMIDLGSVIGSGSPVVEITDISSLKLTVSVPERDILKFKLNQSVEVAADIYTGKSFKGKVSNISVQADKSHNFKVQITIPNGKQEIMAGMYGSVSLNNAESITALAIPRKALVGSSKNPQVYVIRGGKSLLISFNAGTSDGEFIEVVNGLQSNDQIITKGQVNIQDKSNVKIKK